MTGIWDHLVALRDGSAPDKLAQDSEDTVGASLLAKDRKAVPNKDDSDQKSKNTVSPSP